MKTKEDYRIAVWGFSTQYRKLQSQQKVMPSQSWRPELNQSFYFFAEDQDIQSQQEMVGKLKQVLKRPEDLFVSKEELPFLSDQSLVFHFGTAQLKGSFSCQPYPALSELSRAPQLKKQLWGDLQRFL